MPAKVNIGLKVISRCKAAFYKLNLDDITVDVAWNDTAARLNCDTSKPDDSK